MNIKQQLNVWIINQFLICSHLNCSVFIILFKQIPPWFLVTAVTQTYALDISSFQGSWSYDVSADLFIFNWRSIDRLFALIATIIMNIMILKRTALWGRSKWSPFRSFPILLILVAILSLSQIAASQNVNNENVAIQSIDDLNQSTKHESSVLVNPNESQSIVRKVSEREIDASFASEVRKSFLK